MPTPPPLNPAADDDPFPDWPLGEDRPVRVADECFWLPASAATCPECDGRLYVDIYEVTDQGDATGIHWYCERATVFTPKTEEDFRHQPEADEVRLIDQQIRQWLNSRYCWSMSFPHRAKEHFT